MKKVALLLLTLCLCCWEIKAQCPIKNVLDITICAGTSLGVETYTIGGDSSINYGYEQLTDPGTYFFVYELPTGDSIVKINLDVYPLPDTGHVYHTRCIGDSNWINGVFYKTDTTVLTPTINWHGCDSSFWETVHFIPKRVLDTTIYTCQGKKAIFRSKLYGVAGTFIVKVPGGTLCDSTINLTVVVYPTYSVLTYDTVTIGDTVNFYGRKIWHEGVYTQTFHTAHGCDSLIKVYFRFLPASLRRDVVLSEGITNVQSEEIVEAYDELGLIKKGPYSKVVSELDRKKLYYIKGKENRKLIKE